MTTLSELPGLRAPAPRAASRSLGLTSAHLIALTLVLGAGVYALAPPADPDVWWHLRTGQLILSSHQLPSTDPWSLTAAGRDWVAHSWLSEVVIALFYKAFGLRGLSIFRSLGVTTLLLCLAAQSFRRASSGRALLVVVLAVFATSGGWGERPQLLSFLLLILAAELARATVAGRRSPYWFIPLTFVWANLHGLWFLAPALLLVAAAGLLAERRRPGARQAAVIVLAAALSTVAAGITPNGPKLLLQPLRVNGYGSFVSEWGPPNIHSPFGLALFAMIGTFIVAYGRSTDRTDAYTLMQVGFAVLLGLTYIRTIAPAAVLLTPLLAQALGQTVVRTPGSRLSPVFMRSLAGVLIAGAVASGAVVLTALPSLPPGAPTAATRALLAAAPAPQRVINEYGIGGWLLNFARTARPAIDGRAEIYPVSFVSDYLAATKMSGDWRATIAALNANVALLHPDTPLVNGLRDELGWRTVYSDDTWLVLVPPGSGG